MAQPLVVVGLGNPGPAYASTRHNAGAMLVEHLASELRVTLRRHRGQYRSGSASLEGREVVLAVPTTFMNESGRAVARLVGKAPVRPDTLLVTYDELDLPLGRIRLKIGGGTAGHRGVESVCASLRSRDFARLRLGIGRPAAGSDAVDKVLARFAPDERPVVDGMLERAVEGLRVFVREGPDPAQRFLHAPSKS